ncbi:HNH endonuclease signature motif containing protein [Yersinia artesiana]|uniref:HNH endonuclease signature motif containing protein n=1 Tax=Yersinia artesiana TaxID=2890315 RepID=UPI0015829918|nr:HNH endonuclease [Yersinia artesiana]
MSLSLPGNDLYYLSRDNLPPEEYERIMSAYTAWSRICREYEFDDRNNNGRYIINMRENRSASQFRPSRGDREKDKLEEMVFSGNIIMLSDIHGPARLFYIDGDGKLVCTDPLGFRFDGAKKIIAEYNKSVSRRDYQRSGGKPRPTQISRKARASEPDQLTSNSFGTINTRSAGRLLAAGGVYNQNPKMFSETAQKLGGDAAKGFEQVLNEQTAGSMVALSSVLMGVTRGGSALSVEKLKSLNSYLGKAKGESQLLKNISVIKLDYSRRGREDYQALRGQFNSTARPNFVKSLANTPEAISRFTPAQLSEMANGRMPSREWSVHHKIPLDDGGNNSFDNLVLIKNSPEHTVFTNAQRGITNDLSYGQSKEVLWPIPNGKIYP